MNKIKIIINALYHKWIMGECRHLCCLCDYTNECWDNIEKE